MPPFYTRPPAVPPTFLGTFADFVDHVTWFSGGSALGKSQYLVRKAVENAYRSLVLLREWKYFQADGRIQTNDPYSTGTITYVQSTRTVTLAGGTFPAWAALGRIRVNAIVCEVETLTDGTHLVLSEQVNPGADISSGTAYTLYQDVYPLPADFISLRDTISSQNWILSYLEPNDWVRLTRINISSGSPLYYTLWNAHGRYGNVSLAFYPYPDSAQRVDFPYQRFARPLRTTGYGVNDSLGTVSNSGAAVTGVGTAFSAGMIGSVLRFGTTALAPTGTMGTNPYGDQQIVIAVADATHLTLDAAPAGTYSGVKFQVSDPIDLPEYLQTVFLRGCEREATVLLKLAQLDNAQNAWIEALDQALAADNQAMGGTAVGQSPFVYEWWRGPLTGEVS